jgi:putative lipoprotein
VAETEDGADGPGEPAAPALLDITWRATAVRGAPVPADAGVTLLVGSDKRAGGNGGCNSYFSEAQITAENFAIGNVGATMRSCGYELNRLEQGFFEALRAATRWRIDNGTLLLLDGAGNQLVQFVR